MFSPDQYQLLDFGNGRKLERFGLYTIDRPCPAAEGASRRRPAAWHAAHARYDRTSGEKGVWTHEPGIAEQWFIRVGSVQLMLKRTEFGHLGVFPEQSENWRWIDEQVRRAGRPLKILNLFAYTGASTLVAAAAGGTVVHVDAASNVVTWARCNANFSGGDGASVRWIIEDATKFAARERKRGNGYDAVILDPPGYGHGPKGEAWKLDQHLGPLLEICLALTAGRRQFLLLSCHSGELAFADPLRGAMRAVAPELAQAGQLTAHNLSLTSQAGGHLSSGAAVRWSAEKA